MSVTPALEVELSSRAKEALVLPSQARSCGRASRAERRRCRHQRCARAPLDERADAPPAR